MAKDVLITPATGIIEFKDDSANVDASISLDGLGNLVLSSVNGDIILGNPADDVYIGDGINVADIIFEQNGAIRALTGKTLTLGQSDSSINVESPITFAATIIAAGASLTDVTVNSNCTLHSESITLATTTKTQIASFSVSGFRSGKIVIQAYDTITGEVQISELLVVHNGTTASSTEYGVVYTGANSFITYDVDILSGNVRLMATQLNTNSTQYKISKTLLVA